MTIGDFFCPWGWGHCRFHWGSHVVIINNAPWRRTWINRHEYVHPSGVRRYGWESGFPNVTCYTSALGASARRRGKDASAWKNTAVTARANLLSGQRVLEDALEQAAETTKKGKEGFGARALMSALPFTAIPIRISISHLSLIWSRIDYATTLTAIWARPR
jgi:hypothetical protein